MQRNYPKGWPSHLSCASSQHNQTRMRNNWVSNSVWRISKNWKRCFIKWLLRNRTSITDRTCYFPRLREHRVVIMADIWKMYLQVKLKEEDRDVFIYLWHNLDLGAPLRWIIRIVTLLFGAKSCPFLAIATTRHHTEKKKEKFPLPAETVKDHFYVDDLCSGDKSDDSH